MSNVVGVVGLGAMGAPMAANLERAGFEVSSYDLRGTGNAGSVADVAERPAVPWSYWCARGPRW